MVSWRRLALEQVQFMERHARHKASPRRSLSVRFENPYHAMRRRRPPMAEVLLSQDPATCQSQLVNPAELACHIVSTV
jgi:hypothetical protein